MSILNLFPFASGIDVATMAIGYTGTKAGDAVVTMGGVQYRLLTLTSSGTLTLEDAVKADVCVVGGGAAGMRCSEGIRNKSGGHGGAGGILSNTYSQNLPVSASVVVGAEGGASSFGSILSVAAVSGHSGGTGGGQGSGATSPGTGDGLTKYPFGSTSYFSGKPHCGGGGGGSSWSMNTSGTEYYTPGGNGGTNGGNGSNIGSSVEGSPQSGGLGGALGGGAGGGTNSSSGGVSASFYGSGGGGQPYYNSSSIGAGYQGVIYVRIPLDQ